MKCPTCNQDMELLFVNFHCWNCEKRKPVVTKETFEALSDKDKRISLANDVLRMLEAKKIQAEYCTYLRPSDSMRRTDLGNPDSFSALKASPSCHVCALGGLFLAGITHKPYEIDSNSVGFGKPIADYLSTFFSPLQIWKIETAFEADAIWQIPQMPEEDSDDWTTRHNREVQASIKFALDYEDPTERLIAIMNNIVKYGEFIPENG